MKVSTAAFIKNYGQLADKALAAPLTITKNGHDRLVVLSVAEYERLKRRDRRVVRAEDLTEDEVAAIAQAEVPAAQAHLDDEIADWQPRMARAAAGSGDPLRLSDLRERNLSAVRRTE